MQNYNKVRCLRDTHWAKKGHHYNIAKIKDYTYLIYDEEDESKFMLLQAHDVWYQFEPV